MNEKTENTLKQLIGMTVHNHDDVDTNSTSEELDNLVNEDNNNTYRFEDINDENIVDNKFDTIDSVDDIDDVILPDESDNYGKVHCVEDGLYHDIEDAWMYDGSRF